MPGRNGGTLLAGRNVPGPGRPKYKQLTRALELVARSRKAGTRKRYRTLMAQGLAEAAAKGDAQAFKVYRDAVEGPLVNEDQAPPAVVLNVMTIGQVDPAQLGANAVPQLEDSEE